MGPDGFTTTTHAFEFRPGGVWEFTMHGPDGTEYPNRIEWLEIAPPERMVFRHGAKADDPAAFLSTVTLLDHGPASEVVLRSVFPSKAQRDEVVERYGAIEGGKQTLGRLAAYVAAMIEAAARKEEGHGQGVLQRRHDPGRLHRPRRDGPRPRRRPGLQGVDAPLDGAPGVGVSAAVLPPEPPARGRGRDRSGQPDRGSDVPSHRREHHGQADVRRRGALLAGGSSVPHPRVRAHPRGSPAVGAARRHHLLLRQRRDRERPDAGPRGRRRQGRPDRGRCRRHPPVPEAGLVDEFSIALAAVVFGAGIRRFDGVDPGRVRFKIEKAIHSPMVTHLSYVIRAAETRERVA